MSFATERLYNSERIKNVIKQHYPDVEVSSVLVEGINETRTYFCLSYEKLWNLWSNSGVGGYRYVEQKFDCDDFSLCLKAAVAKHKHGMWAPGGALFASFLCGVVFGRKVVWGETKEHAYNFTIDYPDNLIFFEPQNGRQISLQEYTPFFFLI